MISDLIKNDLIVSFMRDNNLVEEDLHNFYSELNIFVNNPELYTLSYNQGYIELVSKSHADNSGIEYLDEIFFDRAITINDVDVRSNPQKGVFIKSVMQTGKVENYFLTGANGIGKTFIALALANLKFEKTGQKTLYVFWPDFIEKSKNFKSNNNQTINKVKYARSLIIDDLGQESISQWSRDDVLNAIIAFRLSKNLDTYITSNYSFDELRELYTLKAIERKKARSIISKIEGLCKLYAIEGENLRNR